MLYEFLQEHHSGKSLRRGGLKDRKFPSREGIDGVMIQEGHCNQRKLYVELKRKLGLLRGADHRAGKGFGHTKRCGPFLEGITEWEVTQPDLWIRKSSLTLV